MTYKKKHEHISRLKLELKETNCADWPCLVKNGLAIKFITTATIKVTVYRKKRRKSLYTH